MIISPLERDMRRVVDVSRELEIVGGVERISLERLSVTLSCRIDTGARSSALHVFDLAFEDDETVSFVVRARRRRRMVEVPAVAPVLRWAEVRSPSGGLETRAFVELLVRLGTRSFPIEVGLTTRNGMRYPMLLGRSAIEDRYLVDVARRFVLPPRGGRP